VVINAVGGEAHAYDNAAMPEVSFTDPEVASVSLTEVRALGQGIDVKTSLATLDHVPRW